MPARGLQPSSTPRVASSGSSIWSATSAAREHRLVDIVGPPILCQPDGRKRTIHMSKGGRAWRGYFQLGEELTSGRPDGKEGIYFGTELDESDPRVQAGLPLHGRNLFPTTPGLREAVLTYMDDLTRLGHELMSVIATGLGLPQDFFLEHYTRDPTILFRIFNYPRQARCRARLGCRRTHRLRIHHFAQAGRRRRTAGAPWRSVARSTGCAELVCLQCGRHAGATHARTLHFGASSGAQLTGTRSDLDGLVFRSQLRRPASLPIAGVQPNADRPHTQVRWDDLDPHAAHRTYGEYLLSKVGRVFPELRSAALKS